MTDAELDPLIDAFRTWLRTEPPPASSASVDLMTLLSQFTALRHEVNLQTKATRAAVERFDAALTARQPVAEVPDLSAGIVKGLADAYDALALALKQAEKQRPAPVRGWFRRPMPTAGLDALLAGYRMSVARIDRLLSSLGIEAVSAEGKTFDPETMEIVEVVPGTGESAGRVIEEVARGYRRDGKWFRYARVRVSG